MQYKVLQNLIYINLFRSHNCIIYCGYIVHIPATLLCTPVQLFGNTNF